MKSFLETGLVSLALFIGHANYAQGQALLATSGTLKVQLLELYSSESCSSCPPADKWVSGLKEKAELWKGFVPVVFHVDYWNNLGWKDGFSSEPMTKRQIALSQLWPEPNVYTPAIVVDGQEWKAWRESSDHHLPPAANSKGITLSLYKKSHGNFLVKVEGQQKSHHFIIKIAQLGIGLSSNVTGGENSGVVLKHDFVVLNWNSKPIDEAQSEVEFHFDTPKQKTSRLAIAAWIEEVGNVTPLQAVGAYL